MLKFLVILVVAVEKPIVVFKGSTNSISNSRHGGKVCCFHGLDQEVSSGFPEPHTGTVG